MCVSLTCREKEAGEIHNKDASSHNVWCVESKRLIAGSMANYLHREEAGSRADGLTKN